MHGEPAWGPGFGHPAYADPQAPKGGQLTQGVLGTFDCLNPFIVKGLPAAHIRGYTVESLLARGYDEPFTLYGLLADSVATDAARSYVSFRINPAARFADGKPVTPADVIFSWELLRDKGRPNFRTYYIKITKAEATDARTVRFDLSGADDRELPLIIGLMPVLAKHAVNADTFEDTSFDPLLGSGPYTVSNVKPGESVTFTRDKNYWGRDLAINRGLWNFDRIRYDYYRDGNTHFEAFKKGLYDLRVETDPGRWQTAYDFPAMRDGRVVKEDLPYGLPKGMQGLVFNTRRSVFSDVRVREAILQLFDFEWLNRTYFFSLYKRTASYFDGCDLSAHGVPGDARERRDPRRHDPQGRGRARGARGEPRRAREDRARGRERAQAVVAAERFRERQLRQHEHERVDEEDRADPGLADRGVVLHVRRQHRGDLRVRGRDEDRGEHEQCDERAVARDLPVAVAGTHDHGARRLGHEEQERHEGDEGAGVDREEQVVALGHLRGRDQAADHAADPDPEVDAELPADAGGHCRRDFGRDGAVLGDQLLGHAELARLHVVRVRDHPARDDVAGAGDVGQAGSDEPAGARLGRRQS